MALTNAKRTDTEATWIANIDLTGASSVKLFARTQGTATVVELTTTVVDAETGEVAGVVSGLAVGRYEVELEVVTGGKTIHFPDGGFELLVITDHLVAS